MKREKISKIDKNAIKKLEEEYHKDNAERVAKSIENLKEFQLMLSKQLPPERYTSMTNLLYVTLYPNATTKEIESSLVKYVRIYKCKLSIE